MSLCEFGVSGDRNVLIAGPTASGKSDLAVKIAKQIGGTVVNADALQVYDCWKVLTTRPTEADMQGISHRLYGHISYDQAYSVGDWLNDLRGLNDMGPLIVVGGTGLYFRALTEGLAKIPKVPGDIVAASRALSPAKMIDDLDAQTKATIDLRNPRRVERAWQVLQGTGIGLAQWHADTPPPEMPLGSVDALVVEADVQTLNTRIETRFKQIMFGGALDEARQLVGKWDPALSASQAIGAPELISYLNGDLDLDTATNLATIATRQYAKRQRTWMRARMRDWHSVDPMKLSQEF